MLEPVLCLTRSMHTVLCAVWVCVCVCVCVCVDMRCSVCPRDTVCVLSAGPACARAVLCTVKRASSWML
jgi:hypothetical protein